MNKLKFQKSDMINNDSTHGYSCTYFDDYEDNNGTGGSMDILIIMGYGGGCPIGEATAQGYMEGYFSLTGDGRDKNYYGGGSGYGAGYSWNLGS